MRLKDVAARVSGLSTLQRTGAVILAVGSLGLAGFLVWHFVVAPGQAKHEAVVAHDQGKLDEGRMQSATNAVQTTVEHYVYTDTIHNKVTDGQAKVSATPGAKDQVNDATDDAGRRAYCMFDAAAGLPECGALLHPGP
jgi:hypothetical protein